MKVIFLSCIPTVSSGENPVTVAKGLLEKFEKEFEYAANE
jgi:hypothetical protein